jgi:hypothetical protein
VAHQSLDLGPCERKQSKIISRYGKICIVFIYAIDPEMCEGIGH